MVISRPRRALYTSISVGKRLPSKTVPQKTLIRSMRQKNQDGVKSLYYEFHFGISTFTHDSSGVLYTEIPRPLNTPLVDPTSQKLERCSFEFLIALPYDSLEGSVDSHIALLQDFANEAIPVSFTNVHSALSSRDWNIDSVTFQITRVNNSGNATAVTCNISLVEYAARSERFVELPKFTYAIPKGAGLSSTSGTGGPTGNIGQTGVITAIQGIQNKYVQVTTQTPHNLLTNTKVKISLSPGLPSFIKQLYVPETVYQIRVSASTPTKFTYEKNGSGSITEYPLSAGQGIYIVTSAVEKAAIWIPTPSSYLSNLTDKPPVTSSTQENAPVSTGPRIINNPANKVAYLESSPFLPDTGGVSVSTNQLASIKQYLYDLRNSGYLFELKQSDRELFLSEVVNTSSTSYQKAVSYLVKVAADGGDPKKITPIEILRNIG